MSNKPLSGYVSNVVSLDGDAITPADIAWVEAALAFTNEAGTEVAAFNWTGERLLIPRGAWQGSPLSRNHEIEDRRSTAPYTFPEPLYELRDYQQLPASKLVKKGYGTLQAPTGSGKTILMLMVAAMLGQRTMIIVHTKELLYQWVQRAKDVFGEDFEVGIIGDGQDVERGLTIAMVQTLARRGDLPADWSRQWGTVILDEAHRGPADTFADVLQQMTSRYLFGATATPDRRDGNQPLLYAIIGPIVASIPEDALVKAGKLMRPTVQMVETDFWCPEAARMDHAPSQFMRNKWYGLIVTQLVDNEERNQLIAENILAHDGRHQLVLSERINHLYEIERFINEMNPEIRTVVITGKHSAREREEILEGVRTGYFRVLLATQLADEGLDIPVLDVLHLTFPRSAKGKGQKLTQQIGRIMRTADGKRQPLVFDYVDPRVTVFANQASARYDHYTERKDMEVTGWLPEKKAKAKELHDKIRAKQKARRAARSSSE